MDLVVTLLVLALIVWALFDLSQKATILKALVKMSLGVAQLAVILPQVIGHTPHTGDKYFFLAISMFVVLLGTADLAACRRDAKE